MLDFHLQDLVSSYRASDVNNDELVGVSAGAMDANATAVAAF
jgi:hypothetical protein